MDAKLIKTEVNYLLKNEEGVIIASTSLKNLGLALSLKNCKEIERGYDLEELADEVLKKHNWETFPSAIKVFKEGFKKALEILGDKKFSDGELENIIVKSWYKGAEESYKGLTIVSDDDVKELIQSVQQTEWDVWLVMACGLPDGCTEPEVTCTCDIIPSLDTDSCLILKRK